MRIENIQLHLTEHAHEQYCKRVEHIAYDQLIANCKKQIQRRKNFSNKKCFIQFSGIWWFYEARDNLVTFITCYGRTNIDMPKAILWAERNKDKINLMVSI